MLSEWLQPKDLSEARKAQQEMADKVCLEDRFAELKFVGGMDVSNTPFDPEQNIFAALIVCNFPSLSLLEKKTAKYQQQFPYISGFLGFREAPALLKAFKEINTRPDLIFVDGHGIAHPRRLGIASHLGVLLDIPTIGVAKNLLIGVPEKELSLEAGSNVAVLWKGQKIAMLLRSKKRSNPLIISPGHRVSLKTALELTQHCLKGYKLPEPTRWAHLTAQEARREDLLKTTLL